MQMQSETVNSVLDRLTGSTGSNIGSGGNSKYPQLLCHWNTAFLQPLAPHQENAFNPCFVAWMFLVTTIILGCLIGYSLFGSIHKKKYGSLAPKNTGLHHYIRINSVLLQGLLFAYLTSYTNIHARYSDLKVVAFTLTTLVLVFIILPLHVIETSYRCTPSPGLLVFWPIHMSLLSVLFLQNQYTEWPVIYGGSDLSFVAIQVFLIVNSGLIIGMESITWQPTHALIHEYTLDGRKNELLKPNLYSNITYTWMNPVIKNAYLNKTLSMDDLPDISNELTAKLSTTKLIKYWGNVQYDVKNSRKNTWQMFFCLTKAFGPVVLLAFLCEIGSSLLSFVQPQLLRLFIRFFAEKTSNNVENLAGTDNSPPILYGALISLLMFSITLLQTSFNNQYVLLILKAGLGCRSSLTSLLYQKSLCLSSQARLERSTGDIVNLVSVDVDRIQAITQNIQTLVVAPIELILCIVSLWSLLGKSTITSIITLSLLIPINSYIIRYSKRLSKTQMKFKDARSRTINEILSSIKSIKLYAWEVPMNEKLSDIRNNQELNNLKNIRRVNVVGNFVWQVIPFLVSFATFATFALTQNTPLTSDIVFPALALLNMLSNPLLALPVVITYLIDASISLTRITDFLVASEIDPLLINDLPKVEHSGEISVKVKDTDFLFASEKSQNSTDLESSIFSPKYALKNINYSAYKGQLSCIVGRVGSGKSSFLTALLGQLDGKGSQPGTEPFVEIHGTTAYCAQSPWIMNASVRDNILFGHEYEEEFYQLTIDACQLLPDIEVLPDGDQTFVGEKGISLSGGQKARLSLARAVYARADIYLLDDVLSAVDSHVGRQITNKVLSRTGILRSKTIILATNSISVLNWADEIYLIEKGRLVERGTIKEARTSSNPKLAALLEEFGKSEGGEIISETVETDADESIKDEEVLNEVNADSDSLETFYPDTAKGAETALQLTRTFSTSTLPGPVLAPYQFKSISSLGVNARTTQDVENSAKGKVKWNVYAAYVNASSKIGVVFWLALLFFTYCASVSGNYWLKHWAELNSENGSNNNAIKYVGIYALFGFSSSLFAVLRGALLWTYLSIRASRSIHNSMSKSLFRAPMSFFERTPIGRIMNRFTSDISKIDDTLPRAFSGFFASLVSTLFTIGVVAVVIPPFMIIVVILSFAYFHYQQYYASVSRELKRLVSVSRSPIYAHFQESLNGVDTIRAFHQTERFKYLDDSNLDFNLKSLYMLRSSNRWLSSRLQFIGSIAILSASALSISTLITSSPLSAGTAGFVMTYALQVTNSLSFVVRMSAEVESTIVAFERCLEYCELPVEEEEDVEYLKPSKSFPGEGAISFENYSTRYRKNLDLILKDISFDIKPREKIGVVGRTGAGKSSLTLGLFRIIEPASGTIYIDGVDICKLSVYELRHHLSIIPQDSQAFEGTLRQNLDPLNLHSDEEIWKVLELAHLKDHVNEIEEESDSKLDVKVAEGGSNFSAGQLQLMCLARALLNTSKVIVLDEATAAVDVQTDKIIQETIRSHFKDRTIITIAHRLDTVMDSDRILALDHGEVKEFDTPANLLANKEGIFYSLCKQGGYIKD
ncbi:multiple drug resistance-associated protein-like transporter 1 [[Candida] anglica]